MIARPGRAPSDSKDYEEDPSRRAAAGRRTPTICKQVASVCLGGEQLEIPGRARLRSIKGHSSVANYCNSFNSNDGARPGAEIRACSLRREKLFS